MADTMSYYDSPLTGEELDAAFRKIPQIDASVQSAANSASAAAASASAAASSKTAAAGSASAAATSQKAAATSETNAAASKQAAASSATEAASSASAAAASKTAAATSASAAASSQNAAATSESNSAASKQAAAISASAAAASAKLAQSWTEGGTGTRTGEDTDNAKYWCGKAQQATQFDPATYYTKAQADTRYQMPVGYIFDWAPVSGSSVDLSTAAKVAAYFGYGTWKEISGRFTFGRDSTHEVGSTGGEAEHTLTTSEMPAHQHIPQYDGNFLLLNLKTASEITKGFAEGGLWPNVPKGQTHTTSSVGGDKPHNNMPPYMTVYKWQRIA